MRASLRWSTDFGVGGSVFGGSKIGCCGDAVRGLKKIVSGGVIKENIAGEPTRMG